MKKLQSRFSLTLSLVLFVFLMMLLSFMIVGLLAIVVIKTNSHQLVPNFPSRYRFLGPLFLLFFVSVIIGTTLTALFSKRTLRPFKQAISAFNRVGSGDFNVSLSFKGTPYELQELSDSFNRMVKELNSIETLRGDFINHFSHEFKTPIVSIQGFATLLKNENLPLEDRQKYIDIIIQESARLTTLSSNILNLTKIENIEIVTEKSWIQLDEQLRQVILLLEPKWQAKGITFDLELEETSLFSNEELLQQMWVNLIDNAIKYSEKNGEITVKLMPLNESVEVTIIDDGIGMDLQTQESLYNKFYQGDPSRSKEGNGLGLSVVKKIIALCNGTISLKSKLGEGSQFTITLKK